MEVINKAIGDILQAINLTDLGQNINNYSREFYKSLLYVSDHNHDKAIKNITCILNDNCLLVQSTKYYIHVSYNTSNNESKRVVLYNSLKYVRYQEVDLNNLNHLHTTLFSRIDVCGSETKHLLRGLQSLYDGQEFIKELYNIMHMMRRLYYSPLQEIQVVAEKVIVTVIAWLSDNNIKRELTKFSAFPNWDTHNYFTIAKFIDKYNGALKKQFCKLVTEQVFIGLGSNYSSHAASILFTALINKSDLEVFTETIFPILREYLVEKDDSNRTLTGSIVKYILPTCSDKYRLDFYEMCVKETNLNFHYALNLISYNYLKFSISKSEYVIKMVSTCLETDNESNLRIGFSIMCRFRKLSADISPLEFRIIKKIIKRITVFENSYINTFRFFISHMSVTLNDLNENCDHEKYLDFFTWLYLTCLEKLEQNHEQNTRIFGNIFYATLQILTRSSQELKLDYNLPKNKKYDEFQNPIYLELLKEKKFYFVSKYTFHKFLTEFIDRDYYVAAVSDIISNYFMLQMDQQSLTKLEKNLDLFLFTSNYCASNKSLYCVDVILTFYRNDEVKCAKLFRKMMSVMTLQFEQVKRGNVYERIEKFPLFIVMHCVLRVIPHVNLVDETLLALFVRIQNIITCILDNIGVTYNEALYLESKSSKAIEHSIIICVDTMYSILSKIEFPQSNCRIMLDVLRKIISDSNLKRPVSHAAAKLEQLLNDGSNQRKLFMDMYFEQEICFKINSRRSTKIRRNPGTRLILHSLLHGIPNQDFFHAAVKFLIQSGYSDSIDSVSAALHTLESLVSDSNLKSKMAVYMQELFNLSLSSLDSTEFTVKNASMQLFQAITSRLLGQKSEEGSRPLSAVEVFHIYPEIRDIMLCNLFTYNPTEVVSKVAILSFLSESDYNTYQYCEREANSIDFNQLKSLFCHPDVASFAVKAYVAVCPSVEIFGRMIKNLNLFSVEQLSTNEKFYRMCAVEQLYKRFLVQNVNKEKVNLLNYTIACNSSIYSIVAATNLFNVPPSSLIDAFNKVVDKSCTLQNEKFFIFILNAIRPSHFSKCLNICINLNYSQFFLIHCLNIVNEKCRFSKYKEFVSDIIIVLINFLMVLNKPSVPVIVNFYKTIMCLFDLQNNFCHSINRVRAPRKNILEYDVHRQHIWLVVYACKPNLNDTEQNHVSKIIVNAFRICEIGKLDECYQVSIMLRNLFVLLQDRDRINFVYLLIVLTLQLDELCEVNEFFFYLSGKNLSILEYFDWLLKTEETIFLKNPSDVKLLTRKLFTFASNYKVPDKNEKNFYFNSDLAREKLTFLVYIISLFFRLQKEIKSK